MRFHGILVLRDEADILPQTFAHLLTWVDSLHIFDTGSTDGTWELVREWAGREPRINPLGREEVVYHNGLRGMVFNRVRAGFEPGDWVARLDADEIYHIPPPEFVRERLQRCEGRVFGQHYDFLITRAEAAAWGARPETPEERARPIEERRTRYIVQDFPEPRLFRYRRLMRWAEDSYVPARGGLIARARIPIRHYRWRDPAQAARRCALRSAARAAGAPVGPHWDLRDWRDWLANDDDPRLLRWRPGEPLPDPALTNHVGRSAWASPLLYRTGLVHVLDRIDRPRVARAQSGTGLGWHGPPARGWADHERGGSSDSARAGGPCHPRRGTQDNQGTR